MSRRLVRERQKLKKHEASGPIRQSFFFFPNLMPSVCVCVGVGGGVGVWCPNLDESFLVLSLFFRQNLTQSWNLPSKIG